MTAAGPMVYLGVPKYTTCETLKTLAPMFAIFGDVAERQARHQE